jgi:hypothetical protein
MDVEKGSRQSGWLIRPYYYSTTLWVTIFYLAQRYSRFSRSESPRDWWRLQLLRRWSHEQIEQVLPGSPRSRSAHGARASW